MTIVKDQGGDHPASPARRRVLGIDPGTVVTGWGLVEMVDGDLRHVAHGTIQSPVAQGQAGRLSRIYRRLGDVAENYAPEAVSVEKIFFARNAESALKLGQARGVALLAAAERNIVVHEYSSAEIKLAVVGYGKASKEQVQKVVASLLHLPAEASSDAADALAAAICHLHQSDFHARVANATPARKFGGRWSAT
jgi:crossover junction endodeoxyribonuclease RuvC